MTIRVRWEGGQRTVAFDNVWDRLVYAKHRLFAWWKYG